jgi:hypothetical protein
MWYELSVKFESPRELLPGEFKVLDFAQDLTNSFNVMGIEVKHLYGVSIEQVRTEQESRLAHPSSKGNSNDR